MEPEASLEIGVVQGPAPYTFSRIRTAVEAPNGDIVVADGETREIRVFDGAGRHVRTFGGGGGGPGEFAEVSAISLRPPDTVLALDGIRQRLTWFTLDGKFTRDRSLTAGATAQISALEWGVTIWQLLPDGTAIGQRGKANDDPRRGLVEHPLRLVGGELPRLMYG